MLTAVSVELMHLHCVCVLLFMFKKHLHMCGEKDCMSLFVQHLKFFVCVCVHFQVEEGGGSLQQETRERNEGNGKEMTKACSLKQLSCHSLFIILYGNLEKHTNT